MRRKAMLFIIFILLPLILLSLNACTGSQPEEKEESLLFVQTAMTGSFAPVADAEDTYLLTLRDVSRSTVWFSDRPYRDAGHIPTEQLIANWGVGDESFASIPPNAALDILDGSEEADLIIITLQDPVYDSSNNVLQYRVKVVTDVAGGIESFNTRTDHPAAIPEHFGHAALFIDSFYIPGRFPYPGFYHDPPP